MPSNLPLLHVLQNGLIISCQAPANSPLHEPEVIAAMAEAAINQRAVGVRIESPAHVAAVRRRVSAPIIGLWKQQVSGCEVYITPQFHHAQAIAEAGADIIAIDATLRPRPDGETLGQLIPRIQQELGKPVMADVDTVESAIAAVEAGADLVGTTLYGYTGETQQLKPPGFDLLTALVQTLDSFIICEGGIASAAMARQAMDLGADAVVVGTAITGIDLQVQAYNALLQLPKPESSAQDFWQPYHLTTFDTTYQPYRDYLLSRIDQDTQRHAEAGHYFDRVNGQRIPIGLYLFDANQTICAGLAAYTQWQWLHVELLWVENSLRQRGVGTKLMHQAEAIAQQRQCQFASVSTFSFQARDFYEKLGYHLTAEIPNLPPGFSKYQLTKHLKQALDNITL